MDMRNLANQFNVTFLVSVTNCFFPIPPISYCNQTVDQYVISLSIIVTVVFETEAILEEAQKELLVPSIWCLRQGMYKIQHKRLMCNMSWTTYKRNYTDA